MSDGQMQDVSMACVLDMSGSMAGVADATRSGFNEFKREQAANPGHAWITLTCFDTVVEVPYLAWDAKDIPDVDDRVYQPRGMTALNDALAESIERLEKWQTENPWFSGKLAVMVMTDGYENSSTRYPGVGNERLKALVQRKQSEGWEFVIFAANRPVDSLADELGVSPERAHQYVADVRDTQQVLAAASYATTASRSGDAAAYAGTLRSFRSAQTDSQ